MAIQQTPIYHVDPHWLPVHYRNIVWTAFEDVSLLEKGTIVFDHNSWAMYVGTLDHFFTRNGYRYATFHWMKHDDGSFISETYTMELLAAMKNWYWADPVMQED